jgi:TolA-binding protein
MKQTVFFLILSLSSSMTLLGCAVFRRQDEVSADQMRVRSLERELKKKQSALEELRERNLVLEKRVKVGQNIAQNGVQNNEAMTMQRQTVPVPFEPSAAQDRIERVEKSDQSSVPSALNAQTAVTQTLPVKVTNVKSARVEAQPPSQTEEFVQTAEQRIYSKILESYRIHNAVELQKSLEMLLKAYSDSVYSDNALYLAGILAFENGDLQKANQYLNRVIREYSRGNKVVSALFAKAMIEKREGKYEEAKTSLRVIQTNYPGSPEAFRAVFESKIINKAETAQQREG